MGLKFFLRLQTIPFCFHVAGDQISCGHLQQQQQQEQPDPAATIKVIKSDGAVDVYDRPVNASELMSRFPRHQICRSDSFYIGQRIPALSETDQLQLGHKYFLLPQHFFQNDLSFVAIAKLLRPPGSHQPFEVQKLPNGGLRICVSEEFVSQLMVRPQGRADDDDDGAVGTNGLCTTPQLKKDYSQLVGTSRSRQWKPKLETIKESSKEKKKKRKISYTSSFKFRTPKSPKTSSSDEKEEYSSRQEQKEKNSSKVAVVSNQITSDNKTSIVTKVTKKAASSSRSKMKIKSRKC